LVIANDRHVRQIENHWMVLSKAQFSGRVG
jgi:hypothetical protein